MRWNTFARSALFAALAALGWLPWVLVAGPVLGVWHARILYLIATTAAYVGGLSPRGRRRGGMTVAAGSAAACIGLLAGTTAELAIGLAMILGMARSAVLYRATPGRAVATEAVLLIGGLLFARFLAGTSLLSTALALWGFLLVQSVFFLIGGVRARPAAEPRADPFDATYRRAVALLERTGV